MSAYRDSLRPEQRPLYDQAIASAGRILAAARQRRDSLPPEEAAREAYVPGGPSIEELTALIERHRAEARAAQGRTAAA
ncbi:hypothetical protein DQ384_26330 [Sphaerisporangium album]|uniref:Uncharacterized protein n=1 Tax=Sphaerisporangium album TaxID=509200 RepID=A0A367FA42_9ACTN|nr:hypothetical protein [Sphaerisporangium album]RCG27238.1 hypothetical protein DQ384_26330 [Sphaerisporangium album]